MRVNMHYCFLLSFLLLAIAAAAQDYKADIQQALKLYQLPKLQLDTKVEVFASYSALQPSQTFTAKLKKNGNSYYSEMGDMRMLLSEKFMIMVYGADKRVVCTKRDKDSEKKMRGSNDPAAIDSLLAKNDSIVYKGIHDKMKMYTVYTGKSMIRRTEIYLETGTGYIRRLVYYYNEQLVPQANKVKIEYTINTNPSFSTTEFSDQRFIVFRKGNATAGSECTGYQVIYVDPETNHPIEK